ncbi:hypothetical protein AUJ17_05440 [Candidatus Micrarchaeota archaeon CG1_02_47_40]|nr:MAG: hypothetical protein AUJ17_05440 [Candidatus Micrarchaeota archaeon CG1_02_47_40]
MNRFELVEKLRELDNPVYSTKMLGLIAGTNSPYVLASRLCSSGVLCRIKNGLYALAGESAEAVATAIIRPSYISFLSALILHGAGTQIPVQVQVAAAASARAVKFANYEITFHRTPARAFGGFHPAKAGSKKYFVAGREKAIADCIARPDLAGDEETESAAAYFRRASRFNLRAVENFVRLYQNKSALRRFIRFRRRFNGQKRA